MAIQVRLNSQRVQIVPWPPRPGDGPSWLQDRSALREALRDLVESDEGATQLRELLQDAGAAGARQMPDEKLVEQAIGLIEDGRLMLLPPEWRWRPKMMASVQEATQQEEVAPAPKQTVQKTTFAVKIVDEKTGDPVSSVRLKITLPDGVEDYYTTSAQGTVKIDDIPPGTCDVSCDLTGATMQDTYEFKGEGEPPKPAPGAKVWPSRRISASNLKRIAEIKRHKVKDGESIDSLAKANGFDWKFLSRFNWGTDVPKEINKHLVDDNGIWKPTKDGKNFMFTSTDHPGIMFIPKKWEKTGLATGKEHVFKVRHIVPFVVRLETIDGLRIPKADYKITWANEDTHEGTLGPQGIDMIEDPPPGPFQIEYTDQQKVLAGALAASIRDAMDRRDQGEMLRVLKYDADTVKGVVEAYDEHFNDYSGNGLVEDLYASFPGKEDQMALEGLLLFAGIETKSGAELEQVEDDEPQLDDIDDAFGKVVPESGAGT